MMIEITLMLLELTRRCGMELDLHVASRTPGVSALRMASLNSLLTKTDSGYDMHHHNNVIQTNPANATRNMILAT